MPAVATPILPDACRELHPGAITMRGVLGEHVDRTRRNRLKRIIEHPLMLRGFAKKDVRYPWDSALPFVDASWEGNKAYAWIGEHVGKWLHAAVLAALQADDRELLERVRQVADELVSYQDPDGYLGTYAPEFRFTAPSGEHTPQSWDVWTHRYNLYGLLTACRYLGEKAWLDACRRMGDLLIETFGPGRKNIAYEGTREGLSALTVLESVVMLYDATGDRRYLELARHFVYESSEARTCVLSRLRARQGLQTIGSGKAYQLMAVLLGFLDLYRHTGAEELLDAVLYAWEEIRAKHLHITGGPWSKKIDASNNRECFVEPVHWSPEENVENCSTVTWIQLNLPLLRLTGEARYAEEAERALYNQLLGAHHPDCWEGAYFSAPNDRDRRHTPKLDCCNSSGPRALALAATHAYTYRDDGVAVNLYVPGEVRLDLDAGELTLALETEYPFGGELRFTVRAGAPVRFPLWLRIPSWAEGYGVRVNGERIAATAAPGAYVRLERTWQPGDVIHLELPIATYAHLYAHRGETVASLTRGPLVFSLAEGLESPPVLCCGADAHGAPPEPPATVPLAVEVVHPPGDWRGPVLSAPTRSGRPAVFVPYYEAGGRNGAVVTWLKAER